MKKYFTIALCCLLAVWGYSQPVNKYLRERAERNLSLLAKDYQIAKRVQIDDSGIHLSDRNNRKAYSVFWTEMGHFVSNIENLNYYEVQRMFASKGTQAIQNYKDEIEFQHYKDYPTDISDLTVVLDPGHFGGSLEEGKIEGRVLRMSSADAHTAEDVEIYEAKLNYVTALLIKEKLAALNCNNVLITRPHDAGAIGQTFQFWLDYSVKNSLKEALHKGDISRDYHDQLVTALTDTTSPVNRNALFGFYRFLDFRARIEAANNYRADVTISIHYNASDDSRPYNSDRYYKPTEANYNMFFVPGGFLHNELDKSNSILDFIRLLVSPDLDNAVTLSSSILKEQQKVLGVPPGVIPDKSKLFPVTVPTDQPGVYARNLPQLRMIRGTVVYGETLLQDNAKEAAALAMEDISVVDPVSEVRITASRRCEQVATGYVNGILEFLKINKEKKLRYSASIKE